MKTKLKECEKHGRTPFFCEKAKSLTAGVIWRCAKCRSDKQITFRRKRKEQLVALFGGGCQNCGYCRSLRALDFHHRDPALKSYGIARYIHRKVETLVKEAEKCVLLCKNCHYEVEDGTLTLKEIDQKIAKRLLHR